MTLTPARALGEVSAAMMFLTRLPVRSITDHANGLAAFAVVGGLLGGVTAGPIIVLGARAPLVASVLAILALAWLSGGLHLDGLADTADALLATTPEAAARARKDPASGPAGVVAVTGAILLDSSLVATLADLRGPAAAALLFVVAVTGSRAAVVAAGWLERQLGKSQPADPQGRAEPGLGRWFIHHASGTATMASLTTAAIIAGGVAAATRSVVALVAPAAGVAGALLASRWLRGARGGLDGDGFGFLVELALAATLLAAVLGA